jgi:hypothetical protein
MDEKYYLVQVKRTNGTIEKGVVVKDGLDAVRQSYHAYLGAYAYGNNKDTDYVLVQIINWYGLSIEGTVWEKEQEAVNE